MSPGPGAGYFILISRGPVLMNLDSPGELRTPSSERCMLLEEEATQRNDKTIQSEDIGDKPVIKIGIVFPKTIFQSRMYQTIIRQSLSEIAQEKCEQEESNKQNNGLANENSYK